MALDLRVDRMVDDAFGNVLEFEGRRTAPSGSYDISYDNVTVDMK